MQRYQTILFFTLALAAAPAAAAEKVEVIVQGVQGAPLENVRKILSSPYSLVQNGKVNPLWFERFQKDIPEKARRALKPYGYYNAEVRTSVEKTDGTYRIIVQVSPGPPVRVAEVRTGIEGPGRNEQDLRQMTRDYPLKPGYVLIQPTYEEAKSNLLARAVDLGYLDARFEMHVIEINPASSTARIDLVMQTGPQYRFDGVTFEGAPRYPEKFLNRYLAFKPGDVFSYAKLGETQVNMIDSERFTEVLPVSLKDEATEDHRVPVVIRLDQAPTKRLRPGIGYVTDLGPRFTLEYRDLNVYERGHEFRGELLLSPRLQNLGAGYVIPGEKSVSSMTGLLVNLGHEDVTTYTTTNASFEVNQTIGLGSGRLGTVYFRLEREKSTVAEAPIDSRIVLPGARITQQRFDSLVRPTKGYSYSIDLRGTHEALGSNIQFLQAVAEGSILVPLPWRLSVYSRVKAGATVQREPPNTLPVSYRFFAGGDRSVRGYAYQSLGPVDALGRVVGGRDILVGSLELIRALSEKWGVAVFYDAGNSFNYYSDYELFQGAGIGLRYYTIVGALRLDLARQIDVPDPSYRIHFTVGFAF